jgi:phospholipid transport system substrate-binding protein
MIRGTGAAAPLIAFVLALASFAPAHADHTPRQVIDQTSEQVLAVLRDHSLDSDAKVHRIEQIAYGHFDFDVMSRLVLARNWNAMSEAQRAEFVPAFKKHLSVTYGRNVERYNNERIEILGEREETRGDWTVKTKILRTNADDVAVDYRLRKSSDDWRVIDVVIEGVSLIANFRSQFQDIISNGGVPHLLELLRQKNASGESLIRTDKPGAKASSPNP